MKLVRSTYSLIRGSPEGYCYSNAALVRYCLIILIWSCFSWDAITVRLAALLAEIVKLHIQEIFVEVWIDGWLAGSLFSYPCLCMRGFIFKICFWDSQWAASSFHLFIPFLFRGDTFEILDAVKTVCESPWDWSLLNLARSFLLEGFVGDVGAKQRRENRKRGRWKDYSLNPLGSSRI